MSGARRQADRAGGPTDLSRQGVSAEGAHPSRELPSPCYDKELRLFTQATSNLWRAIQVDEFCDLTECTFKFGGNCHCMGTFLALGMDALAIATEARRAETENTGSVHEGAGRQASPKAQP